MNQRKNPIHPGYKYTLNLKLGQMPHQDYVAALKWLPRQLGISSSTFATWRYLLADNGQEIPTTAILKMAVFFDCHPFDMLSTPPDKSDIAVSWEEFKQTYLKPAQ